MQIQHLVQIEADEEKRRKKCLKILIKYELRNPTMTSEKIWEWSRRGQLTEQNTGISQDHLDKWLRQVQEWVKLEGAAADLTEIQKLAEQEKKRKEEAKRKREAMTQKNREIVYREQGNVCFVDFEYTAENPHELLSIGAVVMDKELHQLGCFYQTICPRFKKKLSHYTKKITKLEQKEIDASADFETVTAEFVAFLNRYDTKQLYVWGDWDRTVLLQNIHLYNNHEAFLGWVEQMIDLQRIIITDLPRTNNQWGLEKMKMIYGIDTAVIHHALSDALDLCDVFIATKRHKPNLEIAKGFLDGSISLPKYTKSEELDLIRERKNKLKAMDKQS